MPKAYPIELRERVVKAVLEDGLSYDEAAKRFRVGRASVNRWLRREREGDLQPLRPGPSIGQYALLDGASLDVLVDLLRAHGDWT